MTSPSKPYRWTPWPGENRRDQPRCAESMNGELPLLVEELRIGSVNGTCDAFGQAFSVTVDDAGRIYMADFQANEIRVFDAQGECIRTFGREGEGPGEFRMLAGIAWQPPGLLWAMDAISYRLTAFDSAEAFGRPTR